MISIAFKSDCLSLYDDCTLVEPRILLILHGTASALTSSLDEFISLGKTTDFIKQGLEPNEAYKKARGTYGRFDGAYKYIDPRHE